ncbi:hypothetical protein SAMN02787081_04782 [Lysinibacillus fusiformis]|uniref:Uncharacterized protein n=1 Tax=Lysinibacillus fusiformis TaxID=28031 RepID=A0A1H9FHH3_9BACI|nr:hypothetical protein SAMN02787108_00526 [Lysinibacillus fusiformis]SCY85153.1 hypothetical protein SAMN02787081_04782 [Lysinibacillus fusiformis]SDB09407.1 hypothetical protein SAMN02787070_00526 [Lysinibacillus fusiformis]SEO58293.1 hypothetical protein SAMN02787103_04790 [Lysinibacillus fusiformis]SEQ37349.1 hypothetical protein SAMN02787113_01611 [Lysinibacillus fusiformis]
MCCVVTFKLSKLFMLKYMVIAIFFLIFKIVQKRGMIRKWMILWNYGMCMI